LFDNVIVPFATTGDPVALVDNWYVPVIGDCAFEPMARPPAPMFCHIPNAALNPIPDRPPVFVILIQ
jgi:hypothetical protein